MLKALKNMNYKFAGIMTTGAILSFSDPANAAATQNFSKISDNITKSIQDLPGLLSAGAYLLGILLGVMGILKVKDHVENPSQTPLREGAIRLIAGGALFALPILFESMSATLGEGTTVTPATLKKAYTTAG